MSTSTLVGNTGRGIVFSSSAMGDGPDSRQVEFFEKDGSNVMSVKGEAVFRTGTFRNSWGEQATYTDEDLRSIASNYDHLVAQGIISHAPVRAGHKVYDSAQNLKNKIGRVTALRVVKKRIDDGREFSFLLADYDILDKNAQDNIKSGNWVNRSAEIGDYKDNDDIVHSPTFLGFAYVDYPAVERLNVFSKGDPTAQYTIYTEEVMPEENKLPTPPPVTAPLQTFSIAGVSVSDPVQVQTYVNGLEAQIAKFEKADQDRKVKERSDFVGNLVKTNRIAAPNEASMVQFANSLTEEQFSAWAESQKNAPELPILGDHGHQNTEFNQAPTGDADERAYAAAVEGVSRMAKAGVSHDSIKQGAQFALIIQKTPNFTLPRPA